MIKSKYLKKIKDDQIGKAKLQIALGKSYSTIERYINDNDIMLTTAAALNVLKEVLNVSEDELLEKIPA